MNTDEPAVEDPRWYAFVRRASGEREGQVCASYEQALAWREQAEAGLGDDLAASGLIPEAVREHTRQLAAEHRAADEQWG